MNTYNPYENTQNNYEGLLAAGKGYTKDMYQESPWLLLQQHQKDLKNMRQKIPLIKEQENQRIKESYLQNKARIYAENEMRIPTFSQSFGEIASRIPYFDFSPSEYTSNVDRRVLGVMRTIDMNRLQREYDQLRSELLGIDPNNQQQRYQETMAKLNRVKSEIQAGQEKVAEALRSSVGQQREFEEIQRRNAMNNNPYWDQRRQQIAAQNERIRQGEMQTAAARGFYQTPYAYQNL
jgi:hypothetical protein